MFQKLWEIGFLLVFSGGGIVLQRLFGIRQWYAVSKTLAEIETLKFAKAGRALPENGRIGGVTNGEHSNVDDVDVRDIFSEKSGRALLNSNKLLSLGWNYRPMDETIVDTVRNYEEACFLDKGKPFPSTISLLAGFKTEQRTMRTEIEHGITAGNSIKHQISNSTAVYGGETS
ncbi:hypothetical protein Tco_1184968 [Tanacetum coccineum]